MLAERTRYQTRMGEGGRRGSEGGARARRSGGAVEGKRRTNGIKLMPDTSSPGRLGLGVREHRLLMYRTRHFRISVESADCMSSRSVNEIAEPPVSSKIYYSNSKVCLRASKCTSKCHHKVTKKSTATYSQHAKHSDATSTIRVHFEITPSTIARAAQHAPQT